MKTLPLARQGVYKTIQGEGALCGLPVVFVRLAGCSIGCPQCDTDYSVFSRTTAEDIAATVEAVAGPSKWVWITGGEPTDHSLDLLVCAINNIGKKVAVATTGIRRFTSSVDFVSVSPHSSPQLLSIRGGDQINLVPGLNGLSLKDWHGFDFANFYHKYVTPLYGAEDISECIEFVESHPGFRLGCQCHKSWSLE